MPDETKEPSDRRRPASWKLILAIILIIAYAAGATYAIMSDTSARGLTVKIYTIIRSCSTNSTSSVKTLSYGVSGGIWSATSLQTSLRHLAFTFSVDGLVIGTVSGSDSSFGPGQSTTFSVSFINPIQNPTTLPKTSQLVLDLTATVTSGIYSSVESTSDSTLQSLGSAGC